MAEHEPIHWVLLRGLARESGHWHDFADMLADRPETGRVLRIDLPGTGLMLAERPAWTVGALVRRCRARWQAEGVGGRWAILGVSLGGMVAMQWAASHPGDFERAVLINSSDRRSGPPWRRLRPWALRQGLRIVTSRSPLEHERHVLALTTHLEPGERFDRILTDREVTRRQRPVRGWTALAQLLAAVRYRGPTTLPIPTLVLTSDADDMVSSACSRALAQRLEADLRVHDRAGHDLTTDEPAWCLDQIMSWLHP